MNAHALARLGRDTEVRYLPDGTAVANLSLAVNYGRRGQDGKRPTQWVEASLWGDRAVALQPYLTRGTLLVVSLSEVHIEMPPEGTNYKPKLVARVSDLELVPGQRSDGQAGSSSSAPAQRQARPAPPPARAPAAAPGGFDDMDDDIPF